MAHDGLERDTLRRVEHRDEPGIDVAHIVLRAAGVVGRVCAKDGLCGDAQLYKTKPSE